MTQVDLITGFLGSGKTTFLKRYAGWLLDQGLKIGIIENDFGAVNVDMLLLQDLEARGAVTEMVVGGDLDCYRRRFRTKLIALGMQGFDRVLIEPSGIYDADEFFDVLCDEPLSRWYEIGNVIAVVDAKLEDSLSREADYLLVSQLADAGCAVLSRVQESVPEDVEHTVAHINRAMETYDCKKRFAAGSGCEGIRVLAKDWDALTDEDFRMLTGCGYALADHIRLQVARENGFGSLYYMNLSMTPELLRETARRLLEDPACGKVFRVKGFIPDGGGWIEINANHDGIRTERTAQGQNVVILVGEDLKKDVIDRYMRYGQEGQNSDGNHTL